ncbi:MAG: hypothetical protein HN909_09185, partial [Phycisphaerales bacterium]|nr:hypothetical protein [Phycisphaerales bacterium]
GLPKSAGGWGQLKCFSSKSDPKYIKTKRLVEACIIKNPNENTRGWEPTLMMGGGDGQFIKERQRFTQEVLGRSTVDISDAKMKIKIKDDTRASEAIRKAREQRKAKRSGAKNRK